MLNNYRKFWIVDDRGYVVSMEKTLTIARLTASTYKRTTGKEFFVWGLSLVDATTHPFPTESEAMLPRTEKVDAP